VEELSIVFKELVVCTEAPRADTFTTEKEGKQLTRSKAGFNTGVVDIKELEVCRLTVVFTTRSLVRHTEARLNKEEIKSHGSTVAQLLRPVETHMDCTFDWQEYQYFVFLAQSEHCTRSLI
jgi:hypothetical protein